MVKILDYLAVILAQEIMETGLLSNQATQNKEKDLKEGIMKTVYEKNIQW